MPLQTTLQTRFVGSNGAAQLVGKAHRALLTGSPANRRTSVRPRPRLPAAKRTPAVSGLPRAAPAKQTAQAKQQSCPVALSGCRSWVRGGRRTAVHEPAGRVVARSSPHSTLPPKTDGSVGG